MTMKQLSSSGMLVVVLVLTSCGSRNQSGSEGSSQAASKADSMDTSNPCSLLTPQQAEAAVGMKLVMREIVESNVCTLEFAAPTNNESASSDGPSDKKKPSDEQQVENMAKEFTVDATGGAPQVTYTIHWEDGDTVVSAAKLAGQMMGADSMTQLSGIGDEAWLGALASTLYFRTGDVGVEMDLRLMPDGKQRGTQLAKALVERLK